MKYRLELEACRGGVGTVTAIQNLLGSKGLSIELTPDGSDWIYEASKPLDEDVISELQDIPGVKNITGY